MRLTPTCCDPTPPHPHPHTARRGPDTYRVSYEFPVVYLGDNHGSRFSPEVLKITDPDDLEFIGILLDFEESNTSQFLQMFDQINKAAHGAYNKGKDEYKKQYKSKCVRGHTLPSSPSPLPSFSTPLPSFSPPLHFLCAPFLIWQVPR